MQILIIDNNTSFMDALKKLINPIPFDVIRFEDFKYHDFEKYNLIILSGGHPNTIEHKHGLFEQEIRAILRSDKPILGICLGFELIVYAFGGVLKELSKKEKGIIEIKVLNQDKIFKGIKKIRVYESHRWVAEDIPQELRALAKSQDGIEIVKHITRPIYGFQFHPEIVFENEGKQLFNNFIKLFA